MKKIYLFVLGGMLAASQAKAQGLEMFDPIKETKHTFNGPEMNLILKSGVGVEEEKVSGNWVKTSRVTGRQDSKGNQIAFGQESWDSTTNSWKAEGMITCDYTYDGSGKVTKTYLVVVSEGEKMISRTATYTYDGSGKYLPVKSIDSIFGSTPINYESTDSIVYNGAGKIVERIESMNFMGMYLPKVRKTFTYDAAGNITEVLVEEHDGAAWVDNQRFTNAFDATNKILSSKTEDFDGMAWESSSLDSFTYDASNNFATHLQYYGNSGTLELENHSTYTFSGSDLTQIIEKNWNGTSLENENKVSLNYNSGALETVFFFKWLGTDYETEHSMRITFSGGSVGVKSIDASAISMYPNPAVDQINIAGAPRNAFVQILDIQGKVLSSQALEANQSTISVANLEAGIYLVQIKLGEQVMVKRLIKE